MLTVAGVDLALRESGVARPDGSLITVKPARGTVGYGRHWSIAEQVLAHAGHADVVALEGYALGFGRRMPTTLVALAEIGGAVRTMLYRHRRTLLIIPPANLKRFATGRGNATKDEMLAAARLVAGVPVDNHNEADAYWLRRAAHAIYVVGVTPQALEGLELPKVSR